MSVIYESSLLIYIVYYLSYCVFSTSTTAIISRVINVIVKVQQPEIVDCDKLFANVFIMGFVESVKIPDCSCEEMTT